MPSANIVRSVSVKKTARVLQLQGLFEVDPLRPDNTTLSWSVSLPIEDMDWNVGLIVGSSGSGKTTVAEEFFGESIVRGFEWDRDLSIIDCFPKGLSVKEITQILSSVGFNSPPSWLRPFHALSNGEQFRVVIARALAEKRDITVVDEFTSVVDRTVAKIGSSAIAKSVRQSSRKFVAVSCHYDIMEWLEPDWVLEMPSGKFSKTRGCLRRPKIELHIKRVHRDTWNLFKRYHYLSADIMPSAACFCAFWEDRPVAFTSVLSFPHPKAPGYKEHRTVCLPDFQGVGIGNALSGFIASCYKAKGKPYYSTTGNPAMIRHRAKSHEWDLFRKPGLQDPIGKRSTEPHFAKTNSDSRFTAGFRFVGKPNFQAAKELKII